MSPARLRLTKVDDFQFLTCVKHRVWGSKAARFKDWQIGDYLVIIVDKAVAGLAQVSGKAYVSKQRVWDNGLFPYRVEIKFLSAFLAKNRLPILGEVRDALTAEWGPAYGLGILNQRALQGDPAEAVLGAIGSRRNDLDEISATLTSLLEYADLQRKLVTRSKRAPAVPRVKAKAAHQTEEAILGTKAEESAHSRAQYALIRLGRATGCSVWIASNDKNRLHSGNQLGDGCLVAFPNLGLSKEATNRISLIDTIWLRQNAPVCAFEVETTTSIYSGLLRMSDLLALVPALNVKLFIVAPKDRQDKVMAELSMPTFQKIGLSDFCRFIAAEDLESLLSKVEGLQGHIQSSIIDTISVELEDDVHGALG